MNNLERSLHLAARANRERLAVAHRDSVMQEEAQRAIDIRKNMARLKELRLAKEEQEAGTETVSETQAERPKPKKRYRKEADR